MNPPVSEAASAPTSTWPGAFGVFKTTKRVTKRNIVTYLLVAVTYCVVSIVISLIFQDHTLATNAKQSARLTFSPSDLLGIFTAALFVPAIIQVLLASAADKQIGFKESFAGSGRNYLNTLALLALTYLIIGLSFILLIIPFFIILPRIYLASYFLVERKLGPIEALKASWHDTAGHAGKFWGTFGAAIAMSLLAFTIIGIPFAIYFSFMYSSVSVVLYRHITGNPVRYE